MKYINYTKELQTNLVKVLVKKLGVRVSRKVAREILFEYLRLILKYARNTKVVLPGIGTFFYKDKYGEIPKTFVKDENKKTYHKRYPYYKPSDLVSMIEFSPLSVKELKEIKNKNKK